MLSHTYKFFCQYPQSCDSLTHLQLIGMHFFLDTVTFNIGFVMWGINTSAINHYDKSSLLVSPSWKIKTILSNRN